MVAGFLPPYIGFIRFSNLLTIENLEDTINRAVVGGYNPTPLLMTESEITQFVANYGIHLHGRLPPYHTDFIKVFAQALGWWPVLQIENFDEWAKVKLAQMIYLPPSEEWPGGTRLSKVPLLIVNKVFDDESKEYKEKEYESAAIVDTELDDQAESDMYYSICEQIKEAAGNRRSVLADMKKSWRYRDPVFYNEQGDVIETAPDMKIINYEVTPNYEYDPVKQVEAALRPEVGDRWEAEAHRRTIPSVPLDKDAHKLFENATMVYTTHRKNIQYQIRPWDPASLICDMQYNRSVSLYPSVLCQASREVGWPQTEGLLQQFAGDWRVYDQKTELPWPGWTSRTRRHGEYVRALQPGTARAEALCVLPVGSTRYCT